ncbi:MATE family efflux transporter [Leadbettera azotonutricia]|uniref:Multidrug-efflux transporter n=1 Tax=Leadbettera azotonutricia (strain ATCC BAA-888 / DSM 13862 / ZAS-9) TaxID=545695 RepID=F5YFA9_LEAAZ|nr:MATE family efflux transporter [Leadbettera azotonutricia]AEF82879.1 MATE efflux family protein [Leadbettera azotonutricia ZAS-9]
MAETQANKYNLTEGGILSKLLLVSLPIMGTQFLQMAYNLTDMFWLGKVGSDAVASAGAAGMYMWLSFGFLLIGRMGAEIGVAQSLGRGDKKAALVYSQNSMFLAIVLGLFFCLPMIFFNKTLAGFFNFREEGVASSASVYLRIVGFAVPLNFITGVITGTFNASGNSRTPFILNGIGLVANVILDPLFILVLDMGVRGAAIATIIAQIIVGILMIAGIFFFKGRPFTHYSLQFSVEKKKVIQILKWAIPLALESILFTFLAMLTSRVEVSFGARAMATSKVGSQLESLSWLIAGGFGSALVAFIGQNYGAGKEDRIRRCVKISAQAMAIWGIMITIFLWFGGSFVFSLFLPGPEMLALGKPYLRILSFAQLPMTMEAVGSGAFKGTGRTIPPSIASIATNIVRPILAFFLSRTSLGLYGVWIAVSATALMRGVWVCLWYVLAERGRSRLGE